MMQNVNLTEFDEVKYPNRKPWIWLVIVGLVVALAVIRYTRPRGAGGKEPEAPVAASSDAQPTLTATSVVAQSSGVALPPVASGVLQRLLSEAAAAEQGGDLAAARAKYLEILKEGIDPRTREAAEASLGRISVELVTTPRAMPEKVDYLVVRNDSIDKIAKKFGTTAQLVKKSNQIENPNRIRAGDRLRVLRSTFAIAVSKTRNDLLVTMNGEFFKRYRVGTGKFGKTPVGTFTVSDRITEPVWWRPDGREVPFGDPENILGTRWLALRATGETADARGYGIHGTWDESSIGKAESAGCVRMRNSDVEELFDLIPLSTPVKIEE